MNTQLQKNQNENNFLGKRLVFEDLKKPSKTTDEKAPQSTDKVESKAKDVSAKEAARKAELRALEREKRADLEKLSRKIEQERTSGSREATLKRVNADIKKRRREMLSRSEEVSRATDEEKRREEKMSVVAKIKRFFSQLLAWVSGKEWKDEKRKPPTSRRTQTREEKPEMKAEGKGGEERESPAPSKTENKAEVKRITTVEGLRARLDKVMDKNNIKNSLVEMFVVIENLSASLRNRPGTKLAVFIMTSLISRPNSMSLIQNAISANSFDLASVGIEQVEMLGEIAKQYTSRTEFIRALRDLKNLGFDIFAGLGYTNAWFSGESSKQLSSLGKKFDGGMRAKVATGRMINFIAETKRQDAEIASILIKVYDGPPERGDLINYTGLVIWEIFRVSGMSNEDIQNGLAGALSSSEA